MKKWEDDLERAQNGGRPLSPAHPILNGSLEDNLRRPPKLDIILHSTPPDENIQELHAWNPNDRSKNFYVKDGDKFTVSRRNGDYLFRDRIRGKMGYSSGIHVWQLHSRKDSLYGWKVGVATKEAQLDSGKPIGFDQESYGWIIPRNQCCHDYPRFTDWKFPEGLEGITGEEDFKELDKLYCILDMDEGYLAFATDEEYLGVAFRELKGKTLFPMVSSSIECEVTMKYLGGFNLTDKPSPCNCKGCTRLVISEYCKDCSDECVIDQEGTCRKDLSPTQPNLHGSQEDNLRRPHKLDIPPDENDEKGKGDGEYIGVTKEHSDPPESMPDSGSKFFPSSWPFAEKFLPFVRDFSHKVASKLEDDTASAMNKLHGWDGEKTKTAIRHTGGAVVGALGMNAGGLAGAAAGTLIGLIAPVITASFGSTIVGGTGVLTDCVEKLFTKSDEVPPSSGNSAPKTEASSEKKEGSWSDPLLSTLRNLSNNTASEIEGETIRKMEEMGWDRETTKTAIAQVGGIFLGTLGLTAGGLPGAIGAAVLGSVLPVFSTGIGCAAVGAAGDVANVIGRKLPFVKKLMADAGKVCKDGIVGWLKDRSDFSSKGGNEASGGFLKWLPGVFKGACSKGWSWSKILVPLAGDYAVKASNWLEDKTADWVHELTGWDRNTTKSVMRFIGSAVSNVIGSSLGCGVGSVLGSVASVVAGPIVGAVVGAAAMCVVAGAKKLWNWMFG